MADRRYRRGEFSKKASGGSLERMENRLRPSLVVFLLTPQNLLSTVYRKGSSSTDLGDFLSDTSSILTEIGSQNFPGYFVERGDRLFPSHGDPDPSYPFPVDVYEQNVCAL